jgi:hypothetical protein
MKPVETKREHAATQRIDLRKLPSPWKYLVALAIMVPIALVGWYVGKDRPRPYWLEAWLIPFLAWCYIALATGWVLRKLLNWRKGKS